MVNIRPLPPLLAKKARDELNEDEQRIESDVEQFRDWVLKQAHLNGRTDDQFLMIFLRSCKFSIERAKEKFDSFYTIRTALPEFFKNRDINNTQTQDLLRLGFYVPLPVTEKEDDPKLVLIRPGIYNPNKYSVQDIFKALTLLADSDMHEDDVVPVAGLRAIVDVSNFSGTHILQYDPVFMKKMATYFQDSSGIRVKGIHLINLPTGIETFVNLVKKFMNAKNKERIFLHGDDYDALYKIVPKRLLPNEYGGEAGTIPEIIDGCVNKIKHYQHILIEEERYGSDERKRQGKPKNAENLFGIEGSFRKLNVD